MTRVWLEMVLEIGLGLYVLARLLFAIAQSSRPEVNDFTRTEQHADLCDWLHLSYPQLTAEQVDAIATRRLQESAHQHHDEGD